MTPNQSRSLSDHPEQKSINREIAEFILLNPAFIFEQYEKTLQAISTKPNKITKREVSIIYRREVGNSKSPNFMYEQNAVTWLITEINKAISSPSELVTIIEAHSGLKASDLNSESSEAIDNQSQSTASQAKAQLPRPPQEEDDNDISNWLIEQSNNKDND